MSEHREAEGLLSAAEALLYREARLLDEGRLEEWLEMFTDDALYWIPIAEGDTDREPSIVYDDRQRMGERVYRLLKTPAYSQIPASRTIRHVSNVELLNDNPDAPQVRCNNLIAELRPGDVHQVGLAAPRHVSASCTYDLRPVNEELRIVTKRADLLVRDLPLYNFTFIV